MKEMASYRLVQCVIACPDSAEPITWTQYTTRTQEEMVAYAGAVGGQVCKERGLRHLVEHVVSVVNADEPVNA